MKTKMKKRKRKQRKSPEDNDEDDDKEPTEDKLMRKIKLEKTTVMKMKTRSQK